MYIYIHIYICTYIYTFAALLAHGYKTTESRCELGYIQKYQNMSYYIYRCIHAYRYMSICTYIHLYIYLYIFDESSVCGATSARL